MIYLSIGCLVCDEPIKLNKMERCQFEYGYPVSPKICDKCKESIIHTREELEKKRKVLIERKPYSKKD